MTSSNNKVSTSFFFQLLISLF
ncbi:BnaC04g08730D [Brassica napus]|uniref:BnaC04g08730D protein n=1 Tax=Brassica napus TaxID=3708 RepID=A0A078H5M9_BRANA|nr:BnaC04g08730D [Brassica napus]